MMIDTTTLQFNESELVLGLITARGGSKRIPRKNVRYVGGKPLIAWTIAAGLESHLLDRIVLSTDDLEIAEIGRTYGAETPFLRPATLAGDDSAHILCVLHALDWLEEHEGYRPHAVCLLQPTSPLRRAEDIDGLLREALRIRPPAMVAVSEAREHPYFARSINAAGEIVPFVPQDIPYPRKQELSPAWFVNGAVYYNTVESLRRDHGFYPRGTLAYRMPTKRSLQVDDPFELRIADLLLRADENLFETKVAEEA